MGHICSVSKTDKSPNSKKKEALYQSENLPVDNPADIFVDLLPANLPINIPIGPPIDHPADLLISVVEKNPLIHDKYSKFDRIKKPANFHTYALEDWRKTRQSCRRLEYEQSEWAFAKILPLTVLDNPLSLKEIKEIRICLHRFNHDEQKIMTRKLKEFLKVCRRIEKLDLSIMTSDMKDEDFGGICKEIEKMAFFETFHYKSCRSCRSDRTSNKGFSKIPEKMQRA